MAEAKVEAIVTGVVWKVERQPGDAVALGETILILESMKMEIPVESPAAGVLQRVLVGEGESVAEGQLLAIVG